MSEKQKPTTHMFAKAIIYSLLAIAGIFGLIVREYADTFGKTFEHTPAKENIKE